LPRTGSVLNETQQPIHSELFRLGFLEYVASIGTLSDARLFPLLVSSKDQCTGSWSKWWGRYARIYVPNTTKVFHSFRHMVKRTLRNAGCDKPLRDAVMGHDAEDVADKYGLDEEGHSFALPALAGAIAMLRYDGLTITMAKAR
jgi:hypothetical protein